MTDKDHEYMRRNLWCDVVIASSGVENNLKENIGPKWADYALQEFDKQFPDPMKCELPMMIRETPENESALQQAIKELQREKGEL